MGKALTATSLDVEGARYMGIRTEKMNALAWGLGGATATMAGALLVNFWSVNPFWAAVHHDRLYHRGPGRISAAYPGALFAGLMVGLMINCRRSGTSSYIFIWNGWKECP